MSRILWFDVETTDSDVRRGGGIHQLAYIIDIDGKEVVRRSFKMAPFKNDLINAKSLQVCGVDVTTIQAYESPLFAFAQLIEDLKKVGRVVCGGYNLAIFDLPYFQSWWFKCRNEQKAWNLDLLDYIHFDALDVRILAVNDLIDIRDTLFGFKLSDVAKYYGVSLDESKLHDALADIDITRQIYYNMKDGICPIKEEPLPSAFVKMRGFDNKDQAVAWAKTLPDSIKTDNVFRTEFSKRFN